MLPILAGIFLQRMGYGCMNVGVSVRAALVNAVCKKSFQMATIDRDNAAEVVNFVASDISKVSRGQVRGSSQVAQCQAQNVQLAPGWHQ